jgi:hypothetical protein
LIFLFIFSGILFFGGAGTLKWLEAWLYHDLSFRSHYVFSGEGKSLSFQYSGSSSR